MTSQDDAVNVFELDVSEDDTVQFYCVRETGEPFTGMVKEMHPMSPAVAKTKGMVEDGRRHGVWREYDLDGVLRGKQEFRVGRLHGSSKQMLDRGSSRERWVIAEYSEGLLDGPLRVTRQGSEVESKQYLRGKRHGQFSTPVKVDGKEAQLIGEYHQDYRRGDWAAHWSENNRLAYWETHKDGSEDGERREYYFPGDQLRVVANFRRGELHGLQQFYHRSGQIEFVVQNSDGRPMGPWQLFFEDGSIKVRGAFENGAPSGVWETFYESGQLRSRGQFSGGRKTSMRTTYDRPMTPMMTPITFRGHPALGEKDGDWEEFHENGQLKSRGPWADGKKDGDWEEFHENGRLKSRGPWADGKGDGDWEEFHENGRLAGRGPRVKGDREGEWEAFHENGQPSTGRVLFSQDVPEGKVEYFDPEGRLAQKAVFSSGIADSASYYDQWGRLTGEGCIVEGEAVVLRYSYHGSGGIRKREMASYWGMPCPPEASSGGEPEHIDELNFSSWREYDEEGRLVSEHQDEGRDLSFDEVESQLRASAQAEKANRSRRSTGEAGFVYVLINPSIPGLVKVGQTSRTPKERADELSAETGVPAKYVVAYDAAVLEPMAAEKWLHAQLAEYRENPDREFFRVDLKTVIDLVNRMPDGLKESLS
jgi:antitoxin component YwqK of YwqJK toxin-antitoxin module